MSHSSETVQLETVEQDDPGLAVTLKASAPIVGKGYGGQDRYGDWTLDRLERTTFEFRAAGAWDESRITLSSYPASVSCEVLTSRGSDAMPWGWRPSQGTPPNPGVPSSKRWQDQEIQHAIPAFVGSRVLHGLLLIAILVLVAVR